MLNLTDVYILQKNFKEAGKYLSQAAQLDDSQVIWYYYGELYNSMGNQKKAIEAYLKAISKGDHFDSYIKLARIYVQEKDFETAQAYLEKIKTSQRNEIYWMEYSKLYEAWDKKDLALEAVQKSISKNKNYIYSWIALARFQRRNNCLEEAEKAISEALRIDAENEEAQIEAAKIQKELGKGKEYRQSLKELINKWVHRYRQDTI